MIRYDAGLVVTTGKPTVEVTPLWILALQEREMPALHFPMMVRLWGRTLPRDWPWVSEAIPLSPLPNVYGHDGENTLKYGKKGKKEREKEKRRKERRKKRKKKKRKKETHKPGTKSESQTWLCETLIPKNIKSSQKTPRPLRRQSENWKKSRTRPCDHSQCFH